MRTYIVSAYASILLSGCNQAATELNENKLQGRWKVVSIERDGELIPKEDYPDQDFIVSFKDNDKVNIGKAFQGSYEIDTREKPWKIDLKVKLDLSRIGLRPGKEEVLRGIFSLEGNTLRVCLPLATNPTRPIAITAKKNSGNILFRLEKQS